MKKPDPDPPGAPFPWTSMWTTAGWAFATASATALEYASRRPAPAGGACSLEGSEAVIPQNERGSRQYANGAPALRHFVDLDEGDARVAARADHLRRVGAGG